MVHWKGHFRSALFHNFIVYFMFILREKRERSPPYSHLRYGDTHDVTALKIVRILLGHDQPEVVPVTAELESVDMAGGLKSSNGVCDVTVEAHSSVFKHLPKRLRGKWTIMHVLPISYVSRLNSYNLDDENFLPIYSVVHYCNYCA